MNLRAIPQDLLEKRQFLLASVEEVRDTVAASSDESEQIGTLATIAFRYAGGSAIHRSNILQRCLRNINAAAQHFMVSDAALENYGASLLDIPDVNPMA